MEKTHIKHVLDYIEMHIKDELNNSKLAQIAGYSEYHFLRIFHKNVHLTPADYIRKRRISEIVRRIGIENRPISDIAFEYGFNSKENLTRAFKKEHNILPTEFKTSNCSLKLFEPFEFDLIMPHPEAAIAYLESFTLAAYPSDEDFPPKFWNKYNTKNLSSRLSGGKIVEDFGAMKWNPQKNGLDYYIGINANYAKGDTTGTVLLNIAEGLYAIFDTPPATQHNFVNIIRHTWDWIYKEWLPNSGYHRASGFELESYVESSRKYSERIYVPLIKK